MKFLHKIVAAVLSAPFGFYRFSVAMGASALELVLTPFHWAPRHTLTIGLSVVTIWAVFHYMGWTTAGIIQVIMLSLIIMVPLTLFGKKEGKPSKWAFIGCSVYTASYFISNSWSAGLWLLDPLPIEYAEPWRILVEPYAQQLKAHLESQPPSAYGFALRIDQANKRLLVAIYCFTTFFALSKHDIQARMIWLVTAIAETFSFLAMVECKLWRDPFGSSDLHLATEWGIEVSRYACGRAFTSWAPFVPPIIPSLYLIWINSRRRV